MSDNYEPILCPRCGGKLISRMAVDRSGSAPVTVGWVYGCIRGCVSGPERATTDEARTAARDTIAAMVAARGGLA